MIPAQSPLQYKKLKAVKPGKKSSKLASKEIEKGQGAGPSRERKMQSWDAERAPLAPHGRHLTIQNARWRKGGANRLQAGNLEGNKSRRKENEVLVRNRLLHS